jgi:hypothetical protein
MLIVGETKCRSSARCALSAGFRGGGRLRLLRRQTRPAKFAIQRCPAYPKQARRFVSVIAGQIQCSSYLEIALAIKILL